VNADQVHKNYQEFGDQPLVNRIKRSCSKFRLFSYGKNLFNRRINLEIATDGQWANPRGKIVHYGRDAGGFVGIPSAVLDCPAYQRPSLMTKCLRMEVVRQHCKDKNCYVLLPRAEMSKFGWMSHDTISKAKLQFKGADFIYQTVMGHRPNKASWYAITWYSFVRLNGYDVVAGAGFARGASLKSRALKNVPFIPPCGTDMPHSVPCGGTKSQRFANPNDFIPPSFDPREFNYTATRTPSRKAI
jgi:hypothetical protein